MLVVYNFHTQQDREAYDFVVCKKLIPNRMCVACSSSCHFTAVLVSYLHWIYLNRTTNSCYVSSDPSIHLKEVAEHISRKAQLSLMQERTLLLVVGA